MVKQVATGVLLGLAIGDAMGFPTEFQDVARIAATCGPWRELALPVSGGIAYVSDDTQLTLALGEALREVTGTGPLTPQRMEPPTRAHFVDWWASPDNNRAPGATCLRACQELGQGGRWQAASQLGSKGCGANMRVAPVALVPGLDPATRSGAAQLQSALTHGHPTALAASDLTAHAIRLLVDGAEPAELVGLLRRHAEQHRSNYRADWLGDLAEHGHDPDPVSFIARGWDECRDALDRLDDALAVADPDTDPCLATGAGWIAEEALATGLYCFLQFTDDPPAVVRRAAYSSGDSDSIAALAGAFAGAYHGAGGWPAEWTAAIEYRERLLALGAAWDG
ncbi:hypothetical protein Athai_39270 [Actinocatenispora thailandica]|uniref:ADP-ribosylglycohydrolase n=1 Tax=Actinocatenispora thailandica TaxID=227318 RepID=A0A7R7HYN2_9ACTN|nr:ADP-ribosylglycohydrolase family protein [Actinocatenispora thailandica]BCJ36424.1 hypothetical protein Athai_39270 [Actinocatenispora thailandica]